MIASSMTGKNLASHSQESGERRGDHTSACVSGASEEGTPRTLVYRVAGHNGGLVFAEKGRATWVHRIHAALADARTWGELQRLMPGDAYNEVMLSLDEIGEPPPSNSEPFNPEQVPGWSDGDYPPWLQAEMLRWFPSDLISKFGRRLETSLNGHFVWLDPDHEKSLCRELQARGWETEPAHGLKFW